MTHRRKKIWLNEKHTKYCWVKLYGIRENMRDDYKNDPRSNTSPKTGYGINGASLHWEHFNPVTKELKKDTGCVYLCKEYCGAGVVSHELLHAVLWAHKHRNYKKQYPIIIKSMREEETIAYNLTHAVQQFYQWYWKIEKEL